MREKWIPCNLRPSSTQFKCPYCHNLVYYCHGSSTKSRKNFTKYKACPYTFCPWCGESVEPYIECDNWGDG